MTRRTCRFGIVLATTAFAGLTAALPWALGQPSAPAQTTVQPSVPAADPSEVDWVQLRARAATAMQRLGPLVGTWQAEGTMGTPDDRGERTRQAGTWSNRWLMDGKHLELTFDVALGDGPDERRTQWLAIVSYNPFRSQYETVWIGSGGYRFAETGNFDDQGRLVLTARQDGPDLDNPTINVSIFEFHADGTITCTDTQSDRDNPEPVMSFFARLTRGT